MAVYEVGECIECARITELCALCNTCQTCFTEMAETESGDMVGHGEKMCHQPCIDEDHDDQYWRGGEERCEVCEVDLG